MIAGIVPASIRTSTRFTASRLPNRFVTRVASRSAMHSPTRRAPKGRQRRPFGSPIDRLPEFQGNRLALADGHELPVLDLDQRALLDRVAGVLAIDHVDDGDLAVGAGETRKV